MHNCQHLKKSKQPVLINVTEVKQNKPGIDCFVNDRHIVGDMASHVLACAAT